MPNSRCRSALVVAVVLIVGAGGVKAAGVGVLRRMSLESARWLSAISAGPEPLTHERLLMVAPDGEILATLDGDVTSVLLPPLVSEWH